MWCEVMHWIAVAQNGVQCWNCLTSAIQLCMQIWRMCLPIWNMICFCFLIIAERSRFEDLNSSCAHCIHWMYVSLLSWKYVGTRDWAHTTSVKDGRESSCSVSTGLFLCCCSVFVWGTVKHSYDSEVSVLLIIILWLELRF